jgi:hypothetical protein
MKLNVPRLGLAGGVVHVSTSTSECGGVVMDNENIFARLTAASMNALNEIPQRHVDTIYDAMGLISNQSAHIKELIEENNRYRTEYNGGCLTCESVGELNVELEHKLADLREAQRWVLPKPEVLAVLFHDTYEKLAPAFGYETRFETKHFDSKSPNGQLMIAVCQNVLREIGPLPGEGE